MDVCLQEYCQALKTGDIAASAIAEHVFEAGQQVDLYIQW